MVSDGIRQSTWPPDIYCLNPSFCGIWSLTVAFTLVGANKATVLILLFVEYGLWLRLIYIYYENYIVLILLFVEYGLWLSGPLKSMTLMAMCLNPSFCGIWSLTSHICGYDVRHLHVLILLFVEYGLWRKWPWGRRTPMKCLNPSFCGIWSLTQAAITGMVPLIGGVLILLFVEYGLWHHTGDPLPFVRVGS